MEKIALIGGGLVGQAWAVVFARAGHEVMLYDASPFTVEQAQINIASRLDDLTRRDPHSRCTASRTDQGRRERSDDAPLHSNFTDEIATNDLADSNSAEVDRSPCARPALDRRCQQQARQE